MLNIYSAAMYKAEARVSDLNRHGFKRPIPTTIYHPKIVIDSMRIGTRTHTRIRTRTRTRTRTPLRPPLRSNPRLNVESELDLRQL